MRKAGVVVADSTFLAWQHSDFMMRPERMPTGHLVVDTDAMSALDIAAEVRSLLAAGTSKTRA